MGLKASGRFLPSRSARVMNRGSFPANARGLAIAVLVAAVLGLAALGRDKPAGSPDPKAIRQLIEKLDGEADERAAAEKKLLALGSPALDALRQTADDPRADADLRLRASVIAAKIKAVIFRLARTFTGHTGAVRNLAVSPDGKRILSCSGWPQSDHTVRYWDLATGKELAVLRGHTAHIESVAFSPDGKRALSAGYDMRVRLWDLATAKEMKQFAS